MVEAFRYLIKRVKKEIFNVVYPPRIVPLNAYPQHGGFQESSCYLFVYGCDGIISIQVAEN